MLLQRDLAILDIHAILEDQGSSRNTLLAWCAPEKVTGMDSSVKLVLLEPGL